mmetsp:Transcript_52316/g.161777  ORF Transcript_52316/g.161777 Transcript_52316/m.161777 type:complete len:130 (+) Transcript_52316:27-416(+)
MVLHALMTATSDDVVVEACRLLFRVLLASLLVALRVCEDSGAACVACRLLLRVLLISLLVALRECKNWCSPCGWCLGCWCVFAGTARSPVPRVHLQLLLFPWFRRDLAAVVGSSAAWTELRAVNGWRCR